VLAEGGVPNLQPSSSFNLSGKGACCATFTHGVVVGKVIPQLKAGAAATNTVTRTNVSTTMTLRNGLFSYTPVES